MQPRTSVLPAAAATTTPSKRSPQVTVYTLAALAARLGVTTAEEVALRLRGAPVASLVAEGARITTERLAREAPNLIGGAMTIVAQLAPDQRPLLPALDEAFFRAAVTSLDECARRGESRTAARGSAEGAARGHRKERDALAERAKSQRKVVYAAAQALAGADPARKQRLDDAWGRGDAPGHLARSLGELAAALRELASSARAAKVPVAVTDEWIAEQEALAADLAKASSRADARAAEGDVAQGDVAWWRGASLWFLRQMADMIDAAHEADPRVARLALGDLRPAIRRPRAPKKKPAAKTPSPPATPATPAAPAATPAVAPAAAAPKPA
ncbi:MAG: hypothetical protein U0324_00375 [Polyangiales bacterium]